MRFLRRVAGARILQPLRHRDFALLTGGQAVSLIGDGFFIVALAWQVYLIDNDPGALSVVFLAGTIPLVVFVLIGGALTDRYDRRHLMIAADVVRGIAVGVVGILSLTGSLQLWHLAVAEAIAGIASAFFNPASTAIVPDILPDADLPQANALSGVLRRLTASLLGPALGGFVVAVLGPGPAFIVDALSFGVSAAAVFGIRARPVHIHEASGVRGTVVQIREGFSYVRSKPWIWATLLSAMFSLLFFIGPVQVLLPFIVKNRLSLGPDAIGAIMSFGAIGAIAMAFAIGHYGLPRRRVTVMYASWCVAIAAMAIYGVMGALWEALLISVFINALFELGQVIWTTLLQQLVPRQLLGRVSSVDWMLSIGLVPVSFALTGPVSNVIGVGPTMVGGGLIGAVLMGALLFVPGVRDPERMPAEETAASGQSGEDLVGL
jgi:DHA3 family tetracycline resistance protein-like MFS transporter